MGTTNMLHWNLIFKLSLIVFSLYYVDKKYNNSNFFFMGAKNPLKNVEREKGDDMKKIAVVWGPSGATGRYIVEELVNSAVWEKVYTVGRREYDMFKRKDYDKVEQVVVDTNKLLEGDEEQKQMVKDITKEASVVFCAIGTTRAAAKTAENFEKIDLTLIQKTVDIAKENNVKHYSLLTAQGASMSYPRWTSGMFAPLFYMRIKAESEQYMIEKEFPKMTIFQPGMLDRRSASDSPPRALEKFFHNIASGIKTSDLAKAIVLDAESKTEPQKEPFYYSGNDLILKMAQDF